MKKLRRVIVIVLLLMVLTILNSCGKDPQVKVNTIDMGFHHEGVKNTEILYFYIEKNKKGSESDLEKKLCLDNPDIDEVIFIIK